MGVIAVRNPTISINGTDWSERSVEVAVTPTVGQVPVSTFNDSAMRYISDGLYGGNMALTYLLDHAENESVRELITLLGTEADIVLKINNEATSAANPQYSFKVFIGNINAFKGGGSGDQTGQLTWPIVSKITVTTA